MKGRKARMPKICRSTLETTNTTTCPGEVKVNVPSLIKSKIVFSSVAKSRDKKRRKEGKRREEKRREEKIAEILELINYRVCCCSVLHMGQIIPNTKVLYSVGRYSVLVLVTARCEGRGCYGGVSPALLSPARH